MDDTFVSSKETLFGTTQERGALYDRILRDIQAAVSSVPDDQLLETDPRAWASDLAEQSQLEAPTVQVDPPPEWIPEGRVEVDCADAGGIPLSSEEHFGLKRPLRPGYLMRIEVPCSGDVDLLRQVAPGAPVSRLKVETGGGVIARRWTWPEVKGAGALDAQLEDFLNQLRAGVEAVAADIESFNGSLVDRALETIEERKAKILSEREFLGALKIPVRQDERAPQAFSAPVLRERSTPAKRIKAEPPPAPEVEPELGEFYEHILEVIRAVGRGLERSPGSFAEADETVLRDHMVTTLSSHYHGATYAEAFNREGKTDILVRVYDKNAFIGECKWWDGPKTLHDALDQLFGYTTWRDSRVALIFYVRARGLTEIIDKARTALAERDEFIDWEPSEEENELRCRVHWPDDRERTATLTAFFIHLPDRPERG